MAALTFCPSAFKRLLLSGAFSALALCILTSAATTFTRNGITYYWLGNAVYQWNGARAACPGGLVWIEDMAELSWLRGQLAGSSYWTAAGGGATTWPNGEPFPTDVPITGTRASGKALRLDLHDNKLAWIQDNNAYKVICKGGKATTPTASTTTPVTTTPTALAPSCSRSGSCLNIRLLADNQRQNPPGSQLESLSTRSSTTCAARCLANRACCAFELREASGRCRLLAAVQQAMWVTEEGSQIFGIEN